MEKEKLTEEEMDAKSQKDEVETGELRVYEVSYLVLPFVTEEDISKEASRVKEHVTVSGGTVLSEEEPKLIKLAYPMFKVIANKNTKFENAYFGWVKFEGEAGNISKVKKSLENNENILRFLILKTTKDTVSTRKPFVFASKTSAKPAPAATAADEVKTEVSQEINEEELDKTIDDLVIN